MAFLISAQSDPSGRILFIFISLRRIQCRGSFGCTNSRVSAASLSLNHSRTASLRRRKSARQR
jgi:hypothetical protein